jgi:hypothetical protein
VGERATPLAVTATWAVPVDRIAPAVGLGDDGAVRRVEERLMSLAEQGHVRRSRVFRDRWLATGLAL